MLQSMGSQRAGHDLVTEQQLKNKTFNHLKPTEIIGMTNICNTQKDYEMFFL